ncbi:unnamed protein product [Umbelopsis ramanniana]
MQKPDDSNDPHPLYQPMKPDVPDYKPVPVEEQLGSTKYSKYEAETAAGNKTDAGYKTDSYTPVPAPVLKQNWFGRLSRRTKIIAGVVILIVIFLAAFIPAYLTTHNNNSANSANTTDTTNTTTVPSGRPNMTDAGLPISNATYRISIAGGRTGCNQYLSVIDCAGGGLVDMYSGDDNSGRQQWLFQLVEGKTNVYNIVVGGRSGCNTFLSVQGCPSNYVTLQGGDDQSGRQEWQANPIANTTNQFNLILPQGRTGCYPYLSTADCTNSSNLVDMWYEDDNSGRQRWVLTRIF